MLNLRYHTMMLSSVGISTELAQADNSTHQYCTCVCRVRTVCHSWRSWWWEIFRVSRMALER